MLQQLTITTEESAQLRPLLEVAMQNEAKLIAHSISRTRTKLAQFEQRFGLSSLEFARRFGSAELEESFDFIEWVGEIKMLDLLEAQQRALAGAHIAD